MNCGTCKYWNNEGFVLARNGSLSQDATKNEAAGSCRRYAPSARQGNWRSWPNTLASDFCHDYVEGEIKIEIKRPAVEPVAPAPTADAVMGKTFFGRGRKKSVDTKQV